jgi:diguanylate cyclase (GGDEF)-like protein
VRHAPDAYAAIVLLKTEGPRPCLVDAEAVASRPRMALRALKRAAGSQPVVLLWDASEEPDERLRRAASALDVRRAFTAEEAIDDSTLLRPEPAPARPAADALSRPRTGEDDREARPGGSRSDAAFADGCFARLDRAEDLCRFVLKAFSDVTEAKRASLMLLDAAGTGLFVQAARGLDPALVGRLRSSLSSGLCGRAASLGRPLTGVASSGGPRGYRGSAFAVLPLGRGPLCEGVVNLTDLPDDRLPDEHAMKRLMRMARRAGRALSAARRLEQAEALSQTDELTGLPNRRSFERALHRELERSRRTGAPLAVGLLDVDHFKRFNDQFGHPVGDRILAQVGRRLATSFRETDLVCRWGGEEFAALLTGLAEGTVSEALSVLERARRAVGGTPLAIGPGLPCPMVSVSGGVAVHPHDGADAAELLRRADAALYEAKRAGRDRVLHA